MRVAIIGLGNIAQKAYLPVLSSMDGQELYLHCRTPATLERIRSQYRLPQVTPDLVELLRWRPQAAFVLTPPKTHYLIVKQLLLAGADVFVEKPASLHSAETQELAELADRRQAVLMVGFNRRFAPLHIKARQVWDARPIDMAIFEKHRYKAYHPDLYSNLVDDTIHIVDLLRYFCGEARVVSTTSQLQNGMFTGGVSLLTLQNGGSAMIATSLSAGRWTEGFALHGASASLYVEAFSRLRLVTGDTQQVWEENPTSASASAAETRGICGEIDHFFECVKTRQPPLTSGWDSLKTQLLVDEITARDTHLK